jgi:flagellar basal body-associated protein FliL
MVVVVVVVVVMVVMVVLMMMMMMMSTTTFDLFVNLRLRMSAYATKSPRLEDSSDHLQYITLKSRKELTSDFASHRRKNFSIKEI